MDNEKLKKIYPTSNFVGKNIVECGVALKNCDIENCVIKLGVKLENVAIKNTTVCAKVDITEEFLQKKQFDELLKYDNNVFDDIKIVLCAQSDETGKVLKKLFEKLHAKVEYICLDDVKFENFAEVCARYVKKLGYNLGFVIGQNAKKIFAVNEFGEILNGDEILYLLSWWFANLNKIENHQVCGTNLTNTGIEKKITALNVKLNRGKLNEKSLTKIMTLTNSKLGALQSGEVLIKTDKNVENNALKVARILLTIYYENKNIWKKVKENNYLQIYKTFDFDEKTIDKKFLEQNLKIIIDFYKLKMKDKGRIEGWIDKNKVNLLIESKEKTLNYILFKEINKKIKNLLR